MLVLQQCRTASTVGLWAVSPLVHAGHLWQSVFVISPFSQMTCVWMACPRQGMLTASCTVVTASGCGQWFCVTVTTVGTGMLMIAEDCLRLQRTHGRLCNVVETCISRMSSEGAAAPRYP